MNYLAYTPSCEAYIASNNNGEVKYYDVSKDIASLEVSLKTNDASSFTLRLSNKNRKYDGLFSSMDRIVLYATKTERYRLLTGYINETTVLQMYAGDIVIRGFCALYRLQRLYWDKGLEASQALMQQKDFDWSGDIVQTARKLLTYVGGYPYDSIAIGEVPQQVIDWAREIYLTQKGDVEQAGRVMDAFDKMLKEHGPVMSGGGSSSADAALGGGGTGPIKLPAGLGTYATREFDLRADRAVTGMTSPYGFGLSTTQRRVQDAWIKAGAKHDEKGFCRLDGKYLVATTSVFGEIGSWTTFYFSNNTSIETIKIDAKAETVCAWDPTPANKWGHTNGACVLEFCGQDRIGNNPYITLGLQGVTVTSANVHGVVC